MPNAKLVAARKARGVCSNCGSRLPKEGHATCEVCLEATRKWHQKRCDIGDAPEWWYKVRVIEAYSPGVPHCEYCGLTNMEALTIDHVNGGGNKHRRELGSSGGNAFYRWLYNNNYPPGFQVLCYNCNAVKHTYGLPELYIFLSDKRIKYARL